MREIKVIGIGAGDPEQVTLQAVRAMQQVDVFFVLDKGEVKQELVDLRSELLRRHAGEYRIVVGRDPERDRGTDQGRGTSRGSTAAYVEAVDDWRRRRAEVCAALIANELGEDEVGGFLVWGDPALYDSTLAILDTLRENSTLTASPESSGPPVDRENSGTPDGREDSALPDGSLVFDVEVIPGISSVSTLAARHRIGLNQVGKPVQVTTGRRFATGWPEGVDDVVVMLDAQTAFTEHTGSGADIYWGAYLGTPDEVLISGPLDEVAGEIERVRAEARERKGWIMDTYLLRRTPTSD